MVQAVPFAPANKRRPGAVNGAAGPLGPAGAKLQHRPSPGRPDDSIGLGGNEALVVDGQQQIGLQQLALDGGRPDGQNGLIGKDGGPSGTAKISPVNLKFAR